MVKVATACAWAVGFSLFFSACSTTKPITPTPNFLAWSQTRSSTKRVCVLPFTNQTRTAGIADQVRQSFAGHLSVKRFADIELYDIDARLETLEDGWRGHSAQQIGKTVGCDALVYGTVTKASRLYLALYSQLTLAGAIHLVDVTTGQTLVEDSHTTTFRAGGVPLSPLAIVPSAVMNLSNLTESQMTRAVDDLGRYLADQVPDLPVLPPTQSAQQVSPAAPPESGAAPSPQESPQPPSGTDEKTARVEVAAPPPPKAPPRAPIATGQEGYRLEVAAFNTQSEAQSAARLLRDKGYRPTVAELVGTRRSWHRVVLGPFPSVHAAQQVGTRIQKSFPYTPTVMHPAGR
jgi:cell division septation protein DedD